MRIQFLLSITILVLFALATPAEPRRPNIVLILADDLGYGDLGCYGQTKAKTPCLDQMAREGLRFTQFYAGSTVCAPSRCCLMTGLHTGHCFIRGNAKLDLRPDDVTLAEVLRAGGYATGLCGKWGLGHEGGTGQPTRQGFDEFYGYLDQHHAHNYYPAFLMRGEKREALKNVVPGKGPFGDGFATTKVEYSHDLIAAEALRFIERRRATPFFLYLAFTLPHANNEATRAHGDGNEVPDLGEYAQESWKPQQKAHAAMITRLDRDVGRVRDKLKDLGLERDTLILFSSDNGPHKEGGNDPAFSRSSGPLRGIKRDLYEGGIRVPLIACWPGRVKPGVSEHIGAFWDMPATLAELSGTLAQLPKRHDGISFAPTLIGGEQRPHDSLFWVFYERQGARALRKGTWKAVQQPLTSAVKLFDLSKDVGEANDLAAKHPEIVAELTRTMDAAFTPSDLWKFK